MIRRRKRNRFQGDYSLAPLVLVSAAFHAAVFALFALFPSAGKAEVAERPRALMFSIDVADRLGSGTGGVPRRGPRYDGKIKLPKPPPKPVPVITEPAPKKKKTTAAKPKRKPRKPSDVISDTLRKAIEQLNEGREGVFTRPDGDPNSPNPGPSGPPGGDVCAVYRGKTTRYMRRSGSVPEAVGKSVRLTVSIGPSGNVTSKRIVKSSGVLIADKIALGVVPGRFQAPPPECGTVSIRVTVKFEGKGRSKMPSREDRKTATPKPKKKASVPPAIDRALRDLE